jgi:hypothetical protein
MQKMRDRPEPVVRQPSRRRPPRRRIAVTLPEAQTQDLEAILAAHQAAVATQIEHGLRAIHRTSARLMAQLAREKAPPDPGSSDAVRGALSHVDERTQALALRIDRLEDALRQLTQTVERALSSQRHDLTTFRQAVGREIVSAREQTRQELAAFRQQASLALTEVGRRVREGLQAVASRIPDPGPSEEELEAAVGRGVVRALQAAARSQDEVPNGSAPRPEPSPRMEPVPIDDEPEEVEDVDLGLDRVARDLGSIDADGAQAGI